MKLHSAEKYSKLLKAIGDIVYDHDVPTDTIDWSDAVVEVLGYTVDEMGNDGNSWLNKVHPEDLEQVLLEFERARKYDQIFDFRYRFRTKKDRYIWMHDRGVMTLGEDNQPIRVIGVLRNVHLEVRALEERRKTQSLYETLAENFPYGSIFLFNSDLKFIFAAGKGLEEVGPPGDEIVGHYLREFLPKETADILEPLY
ncbi:PAS domain-containing protein, partial [bacterium]|nr:PAS domain-containing protein [bacterium]